MRNLLLLFSALITITLLTSCGTQKGIVAKFGQDVISTEEFEKAYSKSVGGLEVAQSDTIENYKNFLDLYLNFKMKLRNAKVRGLDKNNDLKNEFIDYKKNVGKSYLLEKEIITPGISALYEKRQKEIRVSHIMLRAINQPEDSVIAQCKEIIKMLNDGASFDSLALKYSVDRYTQEKGGDLYYFSAGLAVPEFEEAAYSLKIGEVYPEPVKTRFGFHIIKLTDVRENRPQIAARHILASVKDDTGQLDTVASKKKIYDVLEKLNSGEDFEELAKEFSDDKGSGAKGGDLGFFARRQMVLPFDEAVFNLKKGETSDIVKTRFGYHLIQLTDEKFPPAFEEDKEELKKIFERSRYKVELKKYVDGIKDNFDYKANERLLNHLASKYDTVKFNIDYLESEMHTFAGDSILFSVSGESISLDSLMNKVVDDKDFKGKKITLTLLNDAVDKLSSDMILDRRALELDKEDEEFANLMADYKNGLYIFKLQEEEVWDKIDIDSVKLVDFYNNNKQKFVWEDRVDFSEIFSRSDSLINSYYKVVSAGYNFDSLATKATERYNLRKKAGRYDPVSVDANSMAAKATELEKPGDISEPFENPGGGWSIVRLNEKLPSRIKTFEEAKPEVISNLQESESKRLEEEYLTKLRNLYHPEVFYNELQNVYKPKENTNN